MTCTCTCMNEEALNLLRDVLIPIIASLIGGGLTLAGVWQTLRADRARFEEAQRLSVKPYFYHSNFTRPDAQLEFRTETENGQTTRIYGVLCNTDNAILILEKISAGETHYKSRGNCVVPKNKTVSIEVFLCGADKDAEVTLHIRDVLEKHYKYKVDFSCQKNGMLEISSYTEI